MGNTTQTAPVFTKDDKSAMEKILGFSGRPITRTNTGEEPALGSGGQVEAGRRGNATTAPEIVSRSPSIAPTPTPPKHRDAAAPSNAQTSTPEAQPTSPTPGTGQRVSNPIVQTLIDRPGAREIGIAALAAAGGVSARATLAALSLGSGPVGFLAMTGISAAIAAGAEFYIQNRAIAAGRQNSYDTSRIVKVAGEGALASVLGFGSWKKAAFAGAIITILRQSWDSVAQSRAEAKQAIHGNAK